MSETIHQLHSLGQSVWYDNIQRRLLINGEMEAMITRGEIWGVTSNPSIFNNAIAKSSDYDEALIPLVNAGYNAEEIFERLAVEDIRTAADMFSQLYSETGGMDGYVSLEVNPLLANKTDETVAEAARLWKLVDRPNLMVKIPATEAGLPAIRRSIADGINVNVTLIFSTRRYIDVMDAYLMGLADRLSVGDSISEVASVASFFVSRIDTNVDRRLQEVSDTKTLPPFGIDELFGKAAIANSKVAYEEYNKFFSSERFSELAKHGARVQRLLWASTSTKNPSYSDVKYVEELIGPGTINTIPPQTLEAFKDHGRVIESISTGLEQSVDILKRLHSFGIPMNAVTLELEQQGVKAFADAYTSLLQTIESRRENILE